VPPQKRKKCLSAQGKRRYFFDAMYRLGRLPPRGKKFVHSLLIEVKGVLAWQEEKRGQNSLLAEETKPGPTKRKGEITH